MRPRSIRPGISVRWLACTFHEASHMRGSATFFLLAGIVLVAGWAPLNAVATGDRQMIVVRCGGDALPEAEGGCRSTSQLMLAIKERIAASPLYELISESPGPLPPHAELIFLERPISGEPPNGLTSVARIYLWVTPLTPPGRGQLLGARIGDSPGKMTRAELQEQADALLSEVESIVRPVRLPSGKQ